MDKRSNGFEIAFGFTAYDDNYEMLHEPDYGEIKVFMKSWSSSDSFTEFSELEFRPCTDEELGLGPNGFDDPNSRFYKMSENEYVWFTTYKKKF